MRLSQLEASAARQCCCDGAKRVRPHSASIAACLVEQFVQDERDDDVRLDSQFPATVQLRQDLH